MLVRRAVLGSVLLTASSLVRPVLKTAAIEPPLETIARYKQAAQEEQERTQALRERALKPNSVGTLGAEPVRAPQSRRVINLRGQLEPESEDDTVKTYSNKYAARIAEINEESSRKARLPDMSNSVPVRRDGLLSIKPNNMQCDATGRNCKFVGAAGAVAPTSSPDDVPAGKFLREDLELLKAGL